jgi:pilus assembly protein CpaF
MNERETHAMSLRERLAARRHAEAALPSESPRSTLAAPTLVVDEKVKAPAVPTSFSATKAAVHNLLVERFADEIDIADRDILRTRIAAITEEYMRSTGVTVNRLDYGRLVDALVDDVLGLGPLEPLLDDPSITEVMVNQPGQVYVERNGQVSLSPVVFENNEQLRKIIDRIVTSIGRRVDESSPMCDARLSDGSRVNVVLPPIALDGPYLTIRKFSRETLGPRELLAMGTATAAMIQFLESAVRSRLSILVSGGTSSGKTTLLNILSGFIPGDERIVTIEDAAELQLRQAHVIRLEARPPNVEGKGAIVIRDLVRNSLRMRPDRIIVGECRGAEALDMLQAMNTGHEGSMTTIHANSAYDAISRLETMVLMAGTDLPARATQKQIAAAIDVIVQTERVRGGARKIVGISEVTGLVNGETQYQDLFQFRQTGVDGEGRAEGYHTATGTLPVHLGVFAERGERLPEHIFEPDPRAASTNGVAP